MTRLENGEEPHQQTTQQNTENDYIRSSVGEQEQTQHIDQTRDDAPQTTNTSRTSASYDVPTSYDGREDKSEKKNDKGELYRSAEFEKNKLRESIDIDDVKEIRIEEIANDEEMQQVDLDLGIATSPNTQAVIASVNSDLVGSNISMDSTLNTDYEQKNPAPVKSLLSTIFFAYVTGLVRLGHDKTLALEDLFGVPIKERSRTVFGKFRELYLEKESTIKHKTLIFNIFKTIYGKGWFGAVVLYGVSQLLLITTPILMPGFIDFVRDDQAKIVGWLYGVGLVIGPLLGAFCSNHCVVIAMRIAQQARLALNTAVYDKALRMSIGKEGGASLGEIVDLLNNDTNRIVNSFHEVIFGLVAPIQIIVITVLLYIQIGPFAFVAIGTIIALIMPNAVVAKKMHSSRKTMLGHTDERLRSIGEFISGIRAIKCYVWESFFVQRIQRHRKEEVVQVKKFAYLKATLYFLMGVLPSMAALATFVGYVLGSGNVFTPTKAYVTLALLNAIRFPLAYIPVAILNISANIVAFGRIQRFLDQPDAVPPQSGDRKDQQVVIQDAQFNWVPKAEPPTLANISLTVAPQELVVVVGAVGSGKSTLLQAILGEVPKDAGEIQVNGSLAYVPQQAWIINATLRDNILMGLPYDEERFKATTACCALDSDIAMLGGGVFTQIGEKGVNLSGGQQQRVSIARAVYSNKDIVLLDDCLSAVDQKVARHIFEECIRGILRTKTVIFITNNIEFLHFADKMIILRNGEIATQFSRNELTHAEITNTLFHYGITGNTEEEDEDAPERLPTQTDQMQVATATPNLDKGPTGTNTVLLPPTEVPTENSRKFSKMPDQAVLVRDEERMTGSIPWSVYTSYVRAGGPARFITVVVLFCLALASNAAGNYWISVWTTDQLGQSTAFYLLIYAAFAGGELVLQSGASFIMVGFGLRATTTLHDKMVGSLSGATINFFDANPMGRILNRFSRDQDMLDIGLTERMYQFFAALVLIIATIVILGVTKYWIAVGVAPILIGYYFVQKYYRKSSIELKRLEAVAKSPLLAQMVETLNGLQSIRAFRLQNNFMRLFMDRLDEMNNAYYCLMLATQWLGFILDMLGVTVMFITVIVIVLVSPDINYGLVGLAIVYATTLRFGLTFAALSSTQTEIAMNGTERILEYCRLPQEPPAPVDPAQIPANWPTEGRIEFLDVEVKYRPELEPVLKGINCDINPGEKVGIVGRTGAGKSTLTTTLFRMVETSGGMVLIDGVNIRDLSIQDIRSHLTILPQIPMLFMGTMRENIDPFAKYSDADLWEALEVVQMKDVIAGMPLKLESPVAEDGANFSQGQKQLICLARALLQRSRVLVLDEAMAHVDFKTESIIHEAIGQCLTECTVLQIAHRISSIMNSDRVMVMDKGLLKEFDTPDNLLSNPENLFYKMVNQPGVSGM